MTNDQLFTLMMVAAAVIVLIGLTYMWHADHDAQLGRELRNAAGSESAARMAIESANLDRLLSQKYQTEFERAMVRQPNKLPRNVLRFPQITNRGNPVRFEGPGAA